jgi:hypothetical protein
VRRRIFVGSCTVNVKLKKTVAEEEFERDKGTESATEMRKLVED